MDVLSEIVIDADTADSSVLLEEREEEEGCGDDIVDVDNAAVADNNNDDIFVVEDGNEDNDDVATDINIDVNADVDNASNTDNNTSNTNSIVEYPSAAEDGVRKLKGVDVLPRVMRLQDTVKVINVSCCPRWNGASTHCSLLLSFLLSPMRYSFGCFFPLFSFSSLCPLSMHLSVFSLFPFLPSLFLYQSLSLTISPFCPSFPNISSFSSTLCMLLPSAARFHYHYEPQRLSHYIHDAKPPLRFVVALH